jgi:hypothetical protein
VVRAGIHGSAQGGSGMVALGARARHGAGRAVPRPGRDARRGGGRAAAARVGAPVGRPGARREQRDARGQREREE